MKILIAGLLLLANPEFPELDEPFAEEAALDVESDFVDDAAISDWEPEESPDSSGSPPSPSPAASRPPQTEPRTNAPVAPITVRSPSAAPVPNPPSTAPQKPVTVLTPIFEADGYLGVKWGAERNLVEAVLSPNRPLVSQGGGRWLLQHNCEGRSASVVFRFTEPVGGLNQIVCLFKRGDAEPSSLQLYRAIAAELEAKWGRPHLTDTGLGATEPSSTAWTEARSQAVLSFFPKSSTVQLTISQR